VTSDRWAAAWRVLLTAVTAGALAIAGVAKLVHPDDFGIFRLLGDSRTDPVAFSYILAGLEISTAAALVASRRIGAAAAVGLTCGFVAYHVVLGLGFGAQTCSCWGVPTPKRVSGLIAVGLLLTSLSLLSLSGGRLNSAAREDRLR
jgi:hypothetical protein